MSAPTNFRDRLAGGPAIGMWLATGDSYVAEVCAGSGLDWLLIDGEHSPNDLRTILNQLQAIHGHPVATVVRPPVGDAVVLKQLLDLGVDALLIPMVESAEQARDLVSAVRYPPRGRRGVGSAFARASRWNRVEGYLERADDLVTLLVQVETVAGLEALDEILTVEGVDGVFMGPADLAASMGHIGQPSHPAVIEVVTDAIRRAEAAGVPVGVNAFDERQARAYFDNGASFILVGADIVLLARGSEALAAKYHDLRGDS